MGTYPHYTLRKIGQIKSNGPIDKVSNLNSSRQGKGLMTTPAEPNGNFYGNNNPNPGYPQAGYNGQPQPSHQPPRGGKGKKAALIAGASVLTLGLLAGGAYAVTNTVNAISDKDIAKALPSETAFFGEVDLDPSNSQKLGLVSVAQKVKDITKEKDIDPNKDPKELLTDGFFKDLDFESEVKPWLGDKVAFGSWGDYSAATKKYATTNPELEDFNSYQEYDDSFNFDDNSNFSNPTLIGPTAEQGGADRVSYNTSSKDGISKEEYDRSRPSKDDGIHNVIVYEVKNESKAKEAAEKAFDGKKEKFLVQDGYLIVGENQADIEAYADGIKSGTLAEQENFKSDKKTFNKDAIAIGWADLSKFDLGESAKQYSGQFDTEDGKDLTVEGRVISGLSLEQNKASAVTKVIGFKSNAVDTNSAVSTEGVKDIGNLPGNSFAAFSVTGLDKSLKDVWEKNQKEIEDNYSFAESQDKLSQYGIVLPDDFTKLVGTETAFGIAMEPGSGSNSSSFENASIVARLTGADVSLYEDMIADEASDANLEVSEEDGVTSIKYQGDKAEGKLSNNAKFNDAVGDTKNSQVAGFADLDKIAELSKEEPKGYGVLGLNGVFDKDENVSTVTLNWVF